MCHRQAAPTATAGRWSATRHGCSTTCATSSSRWRGARGVPGGGRGGPDAPVRLRAGRGGRRRRCGRTAQRREAEGRAARPANDRAGGGAAALVVEHMFAYPAPVLAALPIPRFAFAVAARRRGGIDHRGGAALAPEPGGQPRVGEQSAAAEAAGVRAGMRLTEALALCPRLALLPPDPIAVEAAGETLLQRLEAIGAAVEPVAPGCALLAVGPGRAAATAACGAVLAAAAAVVPRAAPPARRRARAVPRARRRPPGPLRAPAGGAARARPRGPRAAAVDVAGRRRRRRPAGGAHAARARRSTGWAGSRRSAGCRCATASAPRASGPGGSPAATTRAAAPRARR